MECAGMRESTSRNRANGSTPDRLREAMKLRNTAAVLPPPSLPKKVRLPRSRAISRLARSVARLSICSSPIFEKARRHAAYGRQRPSMKTLVNTFLPAALSAASSFGV
jgi:hypothetical protein